MRNKQGYVPEPKQIQMLASLGYGASQIAELLDCKANTVKSKASRNGIALGTRGRPRVEKPVRAYRPKWVDRGDVVSIDPFNMNR